MDYNKKELKKQYRLNSRPILNLLIGLGFMTVILAVTMIAASGDAKQKNNSTQSGNKTSGAKASEITDPDDGVLAIVKEIDSQKNEITLYDVNKQDQIVLSYTGGTDIKDKYGKVISMSQITIGSMVDIVYDQDKSKLTDMNISTKAWEYAGVNNLNIKAADKIMKIASTKYKYTDDLLILDGEDFISVDQLKEQDELTIRGYEETIWSITVTRGHGYVKLEDYDNFIGNNITIGYESMQQITDDMEMTVREGNFNLTVENGKYSATKRITVTRNKVSYVSLADLGPDAMRNCLVTFEISPFGADLFIDGDLTSYANPIELSYGLHNITVSLGGYTTYQGNLNIDSASKTIKIDLPEATSDDPAVITETDTDTGTGSNGDSNSGPSGTDNQNNDNSDNNNSGNDNNDTDDEDTGDDTEDTGEASEEEDDIVDQKHLIYVQKPSGASVYLDGDFMGIAPNSFKKVIGTHVLTFIKEGYETMSYTIEVANDGLDAYFTFPDLTPNVDE
jgi:hypothetical protein